MWETLGTILGGGVLGGILTKFFDFLRDRKRDDNDASKNQKMLDMENQKAKNQIDMANLQYLFERYQKKQDQQEEEILGLKDENKDTRKDVIKMQNLYITAKAEHEHTLGLLEDCEKQHAETKKEVAGLQRRLEALEKLCRDKGVM